MSPHRIEPERGSRELYSLRIERDLFETVRLVRNRGRIGTHSQELIRAFDDEETVGQALEPLARAKRQQGYRDLYVGISSALAYPGRD